ncbi:hypothetical protein DUNSADRAFT_2656, partial [Dunaliella salina]
HVCLQAAVRAERGLPDDLVRISGGIEDISDLIADLDAAMSLAMATIGFDPANPTPGIGKPPGSTPPSSPAAVAGAPLSREQELMGRIKHLESLLQQQQQHTAVQQ